jgi:chromatin remodeling complex protein RSC6
MSTSNETVPSKKGVKKVQAVAKPAPVPEPEPEQEPEQVAEPEQVETQNAGEDTESKFVSIFQLVQAELKELKTKCSSLTVTLKKLEVSHHQDIRQAKKHKQKRGPHKPTGFAKPQLVPDKLAKFIGVKSGSELTGPEITSAVWKQLKSRNLTYEKDKRVFRTNKEVSAVFNVPVTVNTSVDHRDENGFNFCNLQTYIAHALNKNV